MSDIDPYSSSIEHVDDHRKSKYSCSSRCTRCKADNRGDSTEAVDVESKASVSSLELSSQSITWVLIVDLDNHRAERFASAFGPPMPEISEKGGWRSVHGEWELAFRY
jgi:hypothetical protein